MNEDELSNESVVRVCTQNLERKKGVSVEGSGQILEDGMTTSVKINPEA